MPVIPPGDEVAVYDIIVEPPFVGAVKGTLAVLPEKEAVPIVGDPGTEIVNVENVVKVP